MIHGDMVSRMDVSCYVMVVICSYHLVVEALLPSIPPTPVAPAAPSSASSTSSTIPIRSLLASCRDIPPSQLLSLLSQYYIIPPTQHYYISTYLHLCMHDIHHLLQRRQWIAIKLVAMELLMSSSWLRKDAVQQVSDRYTDGSVCCWSLM